MMRLNVTDRTKAASNNCFYATPLVIQMMSFDLFDI